MEELEFPESTRWSEFRRRHVSNIFDPQLFSGVSFPALVGEDDHQEPKEKERLVGLGQHVEQPCDRMLDHCNGPGPSDSLELVLEWQLVVRVGILLAVEEDENHPVQ